MVGDRQFDNLCLDVALAVTMYPEFVSLLRLVAGTEHVGAVVVTCGPRRIWKKILEEEGLSQKVKVVGGDACQTASWSLLLLKGP